MPPQLSPNTILDEFRVVKFIGNGAYAAVYLVQDSAGRQFAIKRFEPMVADDLVSIFLRFVNEGKILKKLNHPNIVYLFDSRIDKPPPYLIMEYVQGGNLRGLFNASSDVGSPLKAIKMVIEICEALNEAHTHEIFHRDLKPGNVLFTKDSQIKVADFGLAKFKNQLSLTLTGQTYGTLPYMSPEQLRGDDPKAPTDIYSVSVMLTEFLRNKEKILDDQKDLWKRSQILSEEINAIELERDKGWYSSPTCRLKNLLKEAISDNTHYRPSAKELSHNLTDILQQLDPLRGKIQVPDQRAIVEDVWQTHGQKRQNHTTVFIHTRIKFIGCRDLPVQVIIHFSFADGTPLPDNDNHYRDNSGHVAVWVDHTITDDNFCIDELQLFIPHKQLHLSSGSTHHLRFKVTVLSRQSWQSLGESGYFYFLVTSSFWRSSSQA